MAKRSRLRMNFGAIEAAAATAAAEAAEQTAQDIVTMTKQLAPVDTGALRGSYYWKRVDEETVRVGSDYDAVDYALFVEYGTVNMEAQPHFTPSFWAGEQTFKVRLAEALKRLGRR